jgi:nucleotide-binding universal stress UspA family protein
MGTIVVGVDGSDGSRRALAWAADEARRRSDDLVVVHAWHIPSAAGPLGNELAILSADELASSAAAVADAMADEARALAGPGVKVTAEAPEGSAAGEPTRLAHDADLLVVGSRGLGGFRGLLLGSVSQQCAHHARCPIVIVPDRETA